MLVRKFPRRPLFNLLTAALLLAACNAGATAAPTVDVNAINTAAFETAVAQIAAQQTQTALAAPSNTPPPTNTALSLSTAAVPTTGTLGAAAPTAGSGALPTVSFNVTPNTTPLAGFTAVVGSPLAPAATVSLGDACNNNIFVADITIPDGTIFNDDAGRGGKPGDQFQKIWRVQNTGSCTWDEGYTLAFVNGSSALNPRSVVFDSADDFVAPGETADLGVTLTAPVQPGEYVATWRMQSDNGTFFGTPLTIVIEVVE